MTEVPPSRWRVIERGRRLQVIDTQASGAPPLGRGRMPRSGPDRAGLTANAATPSPSTDRPLPGVPTQLRFDGTLGWTTHPFYDGNGPRTVVLDGGSARWIGGVIGLVVMALVVALVVFGLGILPLLGAGAAIIASNAKRLRTWLTRRLDTIAA